MTLHVVHILTGVEVEFMDSYMYQSNIYRVVVMRAVRTSIQFIGHTASGLLMP